MNKITKSFLMLLLLVMGAVSAQAQDVPAKAQWFTDNLFCYKDAKATPKVDRSTDVAWVADPDDANTGCIQIVAPAGAGNDHDCQFWIRGAEVVDANDLSQGAFAEGTGFIIKFKVKADAEYSGLAAGRYRSLAGSTTALNDKTGWNYIDYGFDALDVTTSWQEKTYVCLAKKTDDLFTCIGFNLADNVNKTARTFYFKDVEITRVPQDEAWFSENTVVVKVAQPKIVVDGEEQDQPAVWYKAGNETTIADLYKADPETGDGCIEVKAIAKKADPWDSQIFISVPEALVGKQVALTMKVKASAAVTDEAQIHSSNDGNGYCTNMGTISFGTEWKTVAGIFNTAAGKTPWNTDYPTANTIVLNLSQTDAVTYYFDEISFEEGNADKWFYETKINGLGSDSEGWKTVTEGEGDEAKEIGCYEIVSVSGEAAANPWSTQAFIFIPEDARIISRKVKFTAKVWADADFSADDQVHRTNDGNGYVNGLGGKVVFKANTWNDVELTYQYPENTGWPNFTPLQDGELAYFVLNICDTNGDKPSHTYRFDDVKFQRIDEEDWYTSNEIAINGTKVPYTFGDGEEGGYVKATAAEGEKVQLDFTIPADFAGKKVKMNMDVKASEAAEAAGALLDGEASTEADGVTFTDAWAPVELTLDAKKGGIYALTLPGGESGAIDYFFDNLAFELAPVEYTEPNLEDTEQWYQDLVNGGMQIVSRNEAGFTDGKPEKPFISARYLQDTGDEVQGDYIEFVAKAGVTDAWMSQVLFSMTPDGSLLPEGTVINFAMKIKASKAGNKGTQYQNYDDGYIGGGGIAQFNFTTEWTDYTSSYTIPAEGSAGAKTNLFSIDLANTSNSDVITYYFDDIEITLQKPIQREDFAWTPITENGDFETANGSMDNYVQMIVTGDYASYNEETGQPEGEFQYDDLDPEKLLAVKKDLKKNADTLEAPDGLEDGDNGLQFNVAPKKTNEWDSQFFIRLPYVLPAGTRIGVRFDYKCNANVEVSVQEHMNPGEYKDNFFMQSKIQFDSKDWKRFEKYGIVDQDMQSIVFNLAVLSDPAIYRFDNISVEICSEDYDNVIAYNDGLDAPAASWENILELNKAIYAAKQVETEDMGYTVSSVQALADAIAAGKAALAPAEGADPATDASLIQAKADVEAAVEGLTVAVEHDVVIDAGIEYGTVVADVQSAIEGVTVTLTATPNDESCESIEFTVTDANGDPVEVDQDAGTFVMPDSDVTVSATFTYPTVIEGVDADAALKDGKYFINGQIVIVKDGKKYNAAGVEIE